MSKSCNQELTSLVQQLVQIKSLSGGEQEISAFCQEKMKQMGFDEVYIDEYSSVVGIMRGHGDRTILLDSHLDTVDIPDESKWIYPPFGGKIAGDRLYGRGASDMKGALGTILMAASQFSKEKHTLKGNIVVTGTTLEEYSEGHTLGHIIQSLESKGLKPDLVIIGEPSGLKLIIGQKGRAEIILKVSGKSAHTSTPEQGINSVYKMQPVLNEIQKIPIKEDKILGKGVIALTDIISNPFPGSSVIPEECRASIDRRLLLGETEEEALRSFQSILNEMSKKDPHFSGEVFINTKECIQTDGKKEEVKQLYPAWKIDENHTLVQTGLKALQSVGIDTRIGYYPFCTNGSWSAGMANIPTLGFGPSTENLIHIVDEYVEMKQIQKAYEGYKALIQAFL